MTKIAEVMDRAPRPIQLDQLDGQAPQLVADLVERGLDRAGEQPEHQRRKGHQHCDDELDEVDNLPASVAFRQERANEQAKRGASEKDAQN
jgi:hypothetical protein